MSLSVVVSPGLDRESWPSAELEEVRFCPACGAGQRVLIYDDLVDYGAAPGVWRSHRCLGCGALYLDPRPNAASIGKAYAEYHTHRVPRDLLASSSPSPKKLRRMALRNGYLNERFGYAVAPAEDRGESLSFEERVRADRLVRSIPARAGRRILDFGCGSGEFVLTMSKLGFEVTGIEPDPEALLAAKGLGLDVRLGGIERLGEGEVFDFVTMNHVIEHLSNPVEVISRIVATLAPEGSLWLATPSLDGYGHERFGRCWRGLEPPRHLVVYGARALKALLGRAGLREVTFLPSLASKSMLSASFHLLRGEDPHGRLGFWDRLRLRAALSAAERHAATGEGRHEELVAVARR